jgi:hypothetical protein
MLRLRELEAFELLLLRVPELLRSFEERRAGFPAAAMEWLRTTEQALVACRLPAAAAVASARSTVVASQRGETPAGLTFHRLPTRGRMQQAVAADAVRRAEAIVSEAIRASLLQANDAQLVMRQLVVRARSKGLSYGPSMGQRRELEDLWRRITGEPELQGAAMHVTGLMGDADAITLLERTVTSDLETPTLMESEHT